jgi:hypothetical protein
MGVMFMATFVGLRRLHSRMENLARTTESAYRRRPRGVRICSTRLPVSATIESILFRK